MQVALGVGEELCVQAPAKLLLTNQLRMGRSRRLTVIVTGGSRPCAGHFPPRGCLLEPAG